MASTYSASFRLNYQAPGDNLNLWGVVLNTGVFQLLEDALAGRVAFSLSGPKTLTTVNGATDEARRMFLDVTGGTGGTITAPGVSKLYLVRNASSGDVILTTGGGLNATVASGATSFVIGDGTNFRTVASNDFGGAVGKNFGSPVAPTDAANRAYVDAVAVSGGGLPGQGGQGGKFIKTDGSTATWQNVTKSDVGLGNVDNTSDINKPIGTATQTALDAKADASALMGYVSVASAQNITGRKALVGGSVAMATATTGLGAAEVQASGNGAAMIEFNRPGSGAYRSYLGIDTDNAWKIGGGSAGAASYGLWHTGNLPVATALSNNTAVIRNGSGQIAVNAIGVGTNTPFRAVHVVNSAILVENTGSSANQSKLALYTVNDSGWASMVYGIINDTTGADSRRYFAINGNTIEATFYGAITAVGSITGGSDARWKTNIQAVERINGLVPKRYDRDGRSHLGYIAQEVRDVAPDAVHEDADGFLHLEILGMVAAVHSQLIGEIEDLRRRLDANGIYE